MKNCLSKNVGVRGSLNSEASVELVVAVGDAGDLGTTIDVGDVACDEVAIATSERMSTKATKFSILILEVCGHVSRTRVLGKSTLRQEHLP